jgi:hypothetical protein
MLPHDGVGSWMPIPSTLSPPSATMTTAMPSSAMENIAGSTLGSTSPIMIERLRAPMAREAVTNSR